MPLTNEDIKRIAMLGYEPRYFAVRRGGVYVLRNIDGRCVFLDETTGACRIYDHRPEGCRLYPLVCDVEKGVVVDEYCPRAHSIDDKVVEVFAERVRRLVKKVYNIDCP